MVVPTMLAASRRARCRRRGPALPADDVLRRRRTPATVQRVMALLPDVDLTTAYGLTETSSTIAVFGPDDHRAARTGDPR